MTLGWPLRKDQEEQDHLVSLSLLTNLGSETLPLIGKITCHRSWILEQQCDLKPNKSFAVSSHTFVFHAVLQARLADRQAPKSFQLPPAAVSNEETLSIHAQYLEAMSAIVGSRCLPLVSQLKAQEVRGDAKKKKKKNCSRVAQSGSLGTASIVLTVPF